jgi:hypothetical protein
MRKEMIFVSAIILSLSFSNFALAINDPVAHWEFNEGAGTIAYDSAGDNDGNLINGPVWTTGIIDGALEFDGVNDYVAFGKNAVTTTEFTVAAWANHFGPAGGADHDNKIFLQRDDDVGTNHSGVGLTSMTSSGVARASMRSSIGSTQVLETPRKPYGEWHHYAMTVDSDDFVFYVDGAEVDRALVNQSGNYWTSIDHVYIGRLMYESGLKGSFNGAIDEVIIYDRALSAAEIEELYLGEEPELVGLEITGPDEAAEDSQTQYSAIALYDNNSTADVTDNALWSVEPNVIADIEAGLLTTEKIFQPEELEIYAQYSEDGNTFDANKPVSVFAICPSGSALQFDGVNDYVNLGLDPDLQPALPVTISTWIKLENLGQNQYILDLDKELGWHSGIWFFVRDENSLTIGYGDGGSSGPWSRRSKVGTSTLDAGIWYHVAAVLVAPTDLTIYINGEDDGGVYGGTGGDLAYRNKESFIGTLSTDRHFFNGIIDEMVIYDRALSAQEIQISMHVPLEGNEPNLIAYWNFDEGAGQVAHDTSGNANDGQLGSSPDIDDSDPNWVDSDAPVGICTLEELVERNVNNALEIKLSILEQIEEALLMEDASVNILDGLFGQLDYGYLDKRDIRRVRQEIHSAIQSEEQAIHSVEKSVDDLEDSLEILGSEDDPPDSNSPNDSRLMNRLLIPLKK